jgi:hypothetical protein
MRGPSSANDHWLALNEAELATEGIGDKVAQELAEARRKTVAAVTANLLIQQGGTETELARVHAELELLRATLYRLEQDQHRRCRAKSVRSPSQR